MEANITEEIDFEEVANQAFSSFLFMTSLWGLSH